MAEEMRKWARTTHVHLRKGTPKELGHGSFGAGFLRKCDMLGEVAIKVYKGRGDRDTEHKMMALIATTRTRSTDNIAFHGDADVQVPTPHASSIQPTGQDQSAPMCPGLLFEYCPFGDVEGFIHKWHPVLSQTFLCHWTRHVAEGL